MRHTPHRFKKPIREGRLFCLVPCLVIASEAKQSISPTCGPASPIREKLTDEWSNLNKGITPQPSRSARHLLP